MGAGDLFALAAFDSLTTWVQAQERGAKAARDRHASRMVLLCLPPNSQFGQVDCPVQTGACPHDNGSGAY